MTKRDYLVKVGLDIETLTDNGWEHDIKVLGVQVRSYNKDNAILEAIKFYSQKDNVELVIDKDVVSSSIVSICRVQTIK